MLWVASLTLLAALLALALDAGNLVQSGTNFQNAADETKLDAGSGHDGGDDGGRTSSAAGLRDNRELGNLYPTNWLYPKRPGR